jgi:hypothetical protein
VPCVSLSHALRFAVSHRHHTFFPSPPLPLYPRAIPVPDVNWLKAGGLDLAPWEMGAGDSHLFWRLVGRHRAELPLLCGKGQTRGEHAIVVKTGNPCGSHRDTRSVGSIADETNAVSHAESSICDVSATRPSTYPMWWQPSPPMTSMAVY